MARPYAGVDVARELRERAQPMQRDGKLYAVPLDPPIVVQTPVVTVATAAFDADGEPLAFVHLALPRALQAWLRAAEAAVLDACVERKKDWFRKPLDDDAVRTSFKTFFRDGDKVKVRVPADAAAFQADRSTPADLRDVLRAGACVRCVLELARVAFGRTEFGAQWRLVQVAPSAAPVCLISDEFDAAADGAGDSDGEFL